MGQGTSTVRPDPSCLIMAVGIGLRTAHHQAWKALRPRVDFFEIHPENYRDIGSAAYADVELLRRDYAVSLHGVSLGLGNAELDSRALSMLRELTARLDPVFVSEHLCWTAFGSRHFNHLLPMLFTSETEDRLASHIQQVQDMLRRPLLVEPIAAYMRHREDDIEEVELINNLVERTGCGILLDLTNLHVNALNHGEDPRDFLERIDASSVREVHIAGCRLNSFPDGEMWIDSHDSPVPDSVWKLHGEMLSRMGPRPTLLERDASLPPLDELAAEISGAQRRMNLEADNVVA